VPLSTASSSISCVPGTTQSSRQLKVKQKSNNLAGLQFADLVAHPSRNEILSEHGHSVTIAPFAAKVVAILQGKYDRRGERVFGKKML